MIHHFRRLMALGFTYGRLRVVRPTIVCMCSTVKSYFLFFAEKYFASHGTKMYAIYFARTASEVFKVQNVGVRAG